MKIIYNGNVPMTSNGVTYQPGGSYNVAEQVGKYLVSTFGAKFVAEAPPAPKTSAEKPKSRPKTKAE